MKTKISADFHVCISVPLIINTTRNCRNSGAQDNYDTHDYVNSYCLNVFIIADLVHSEV